MLLSDVCLTSVVYIGPKQRTERPRKSKIGTQVAHVIRDSDTTFKVKRSKVKVIRPVYSPRRLRIGSCSGRCGNVLSVGNCCYVAVCSRGGRLGGARCYGVRRGRRGAGHIVSPRAQLVVSNFRTFWSAIINIHRASNNLQQIVTLQYVIDWVSSHNSTDLICLLVSRVKLKRQSELSRYDFYFYIGLQVCGVAYVLLVLCLRWLTLNRWRMCEASTTMHQAQDKSPPA